MKRTVTATSYAMIVPCAMSRAGLQHLSDREREPHQTSSSIITMSIQQKLKHELRAIVMVTLFFAIWLGMLMGLKVLILEEYQIRFGSYSAVLIGALVLAKVVLILEHVSLGAWLRDKPILFDVILRTLLYALGTFAVMLLEKAFESRHEQGGFGSALMKVLQHRDMPHVWANTLCVTGALLFYNVLAALNRHLGSGGLARVLLSPPQSSTAP